jgi:hypothetical protein
MSNAYPMYLVDDYPDGGIEEKGWVEVTERTANPRDAIDFLIKEMSLDDLGDDMRVIVTGTSHQRPSGYPVEKSDARTAKPLDEYGPCQAAACVDGHIEVIDKITGPPEHHRFFEKKEGWELTPEIKREVEAKGGRIVETTRDTCDECYGTGKAGEFMFDSCEPMPWEACEPDHPEALHFWNIEITDDPDAPLFPGPVAPDVSDQQEKMDI